MRAIDADLLEPDADFDDGEFWAYSKAQVDNAPTIVPERKRGRMSELKLKPCPFCGRTDTLHFDRYQSNGEWWGYIECTECVMTGPVGKLEKDVVDAWNRRVKDESD